MNFLIAVCLFVPVFANAIAIQGNLQLKMPLFIQGELPPGCNPDSNNPICAEPIQDTLPVANYSLTLTSSSHETTMLIQGAGRRSTWHLKVPAGKQLPRHGDFKWSAREIGQDWGMIGKVDFAESDSEPQQGYEPCTYIRYRDVWVCDNHPRRPRCRWEQEAYVVYGEQWVRFYYHSEKTELKFDILEGSAKAGNFSGQHSLQTRVYLERDICR